MIELLVAIAIIGIIAAIVLPSYNKARNSKELLLAREQIAGDIRMAQNYSYNVLKFNDGSFPAGGYGIDFSLSRGTYIIFADINSNQNYDGAAEVFQEISFPGNVEMSLLEGDGNPVNFADVVFKPPYGNVSIKSSGIGYAELEIKIKNSDGETKTITVNDSRLISF